MIPVLKLGSTTMPAYVDAAFAERVAHELPEHVIPDHPHEGGAKSQSGSSGREDAAGPADHQVGAVHEALDLTERRLYLVPGQDQVRVAVAEDNDVELRVRGLACVPSVHRPRPLSSRAIWCEFMLAVRVGWLGSSRRYRCSGPLRSTLNSAPQMPHLRSFGQNLESFSGSWRYSALRIGLWAAR